MKKKKMKTTGENKAPVLLSIVVVLIMCYILFPIIVIVGSSVTSVSTLTFPPKGFSLQWYDEYFHDGGWLEATWVSVKLAIITTVCTVILGSLSAYGIEKAKKRNLFLSFFTSPLTIPTVISGLALLQIYNLLEVDRNFWVILTGHIMFVTPFVVRTMYTSFYRFNHSIEEASWVMGAGKVKTFFIIVLPSVKSGLMSSVFFAFITSFSNLTISTFLATGKNITLPIKIYTAANFNPTPVLSAISTIVILVTIVSMCLLKSVGNKE